jgi:hypothetical protein
MHSFRGSVRACGIAKIDKARRLPEGSNTEWLLTPMTGCLGVSSDC